MGSQMNIKPNEIKRAEQGQYLLTYGQAMEERLGALAVNIAQEKGRWSGLGYELMREKGSSRYRISDMIRKGLLSHGQSQWYLTEKAKQILLDKYPQAYAPVCSFN